MPHQTCSQTRRLCTIMCTMVVVVSPAPTHQRDHVNHVNHVNHVVHRHHRLRPRGLREPRVRGHARDADGCAQRSCHRRRGSVPHAFATGRAPCSTFATARAPPSPQPVLCLRHRPCSTFITARSALRLRHHTHPSPPSMTHTRAVCRTHRRLRPGERHAALGLHRRQPEERQ